MGAYLKFCIALSLWNISPKLKHAISNNYNNLEALLKDASTCKNLLKPEQLKQLRTIEQHEIDAIDSWVQQSPNRHLLTAKHPYYPVSLKEIDDPPFLLYAQGCLEHLSQTGVAIVGTRYPSDEGKHNTQYFTQHLVDHKLCIISGMALGVDGIAHETALQKHGATIAVLGCGLNYVYPKQHQKLWEILHKKHCVVSEYPPNTPPKPFHFPKRNRIISGMSTGTLVTQAKERSGSLITAKAAAQQGRHVWTIPGSIHQTLYAGNHRLVRQGAILVNHPSQILDDLKINQHIDAPKQSQPKAHNTHNLMQYIDDMPISLDDLIHRSGQTTEEVLSALTLMEIEQLITHSPAGYTQKLNT